MNLNKTERLGASIPENKEARLHELAMIDQEKGEAARYRKQVKEHFDHEKKVEYITKWEVYREEKISLTAIFIKILKKKLKR